MSGLMFSRGSARSASSGYEARRNRSPAFTVARAVNSPCEYPNAPLPSMTVVMIGAPSTDSTSWRGGAAFLAASSRAFNSSGVGSRRGPPAPSTSRRRPRCYSRPGRPSSRGRRRFLALEPARFEQFPPLLGAAGALFIGEVRVAFAAEVRNPQPELVLAVDREREVAVHRAAK